MVCSTTRFTVCTTKGGALSSKETVKMPVATEVTKFTRIVRRISWDFESSSIFILLEIGRGRDQHGATEPYPIRIDNRTHILISTDASAISNRIHATIMLPIINAVNPLPLSKLDAI